MTTRPFSNSSYISYNLPHNINDTPNLLSLSNLLDEIAISTAAGVSVYSLSTLRSQLAQSQSHQLLSPPEPIQTINVQSDQIKYHNDRLLVVNSNNLEIYVNFTLVDTIALPSKPTTISPNPAGGYIAILTTDHGLHLYDENSKSTACLNNNTLAASWSAKEAASFSVGFQ